MVSIESVRQHDKHHSKHYHKIACDTKLCTTELNFDVLRYSEIYYVANEEQITHELPYTIKH